MLWELDAPFLRTSWHLMCRPQRVILDYIAGERVRYSNPVKLAIILGGLTTILMLVFASDQFAFLGTNANEQARRAVWELQDWSQAFAKAQTIVLGWAHILSVVMAPVYAICMWLLYRRVRWTLAEHMVWTLFAFSGTYLIQIPLMPLASIHVFITTFIGLVVGPLYLAVVARLTFEGSWLGALFKTLIAFVVYLFAYVWGQWVASLGIVAWLWLTR